MIAEWPLSCVEKVTTTDGAEWIVKCNHAPCTIEGNFYTLLDRPFLIKPINLHDEPPYQVIMYPYIEGMPFSKTKHAQKFSAAEIFRQEFAPILQSIYHRELPVYLKIDTSSDFLDTFRNMVFALSELAGSNKFTQIKTQDIKKLANAIESTRVKEVALRQTTLVHGDLSIDNILFTSTNEFYIIDWQRPMVGSPLIDEYTFVKSNGEIPQPSAILMGTLVQINWFVDCAINWFPPGINTYDHQVKGFVQDFFEAYQSLNKNHTNK